VSSQRNRPARAGDSLVALAAAHPNLFAAAFYALLSLIFVLPALLPGRVMASSDALFLLPPWQSARPEGFLRAANPELGDAYTVLYQQWRFSLDYLPSIPLWNPEIQNGRPFLANSQSGLFAPFNVPIWLLGLFPSMAWTAALKLFAAAFGTFLLARSLGQRPSAALLAGLVYGFSLWLVSWLVYPHASIWALVPWLLLAANAVIRRPQPLAACGLALVTGLVLLSGHAESAFHAGVALAVFVGLRLLQERSRGTTGLLRPLLVVIAAGVTGFLLSALVTLPFLEFVGQSADIVQRRGVGDEGAVPQRFLLGLFLWDYWGHPTGSQDVLYSVIRAIYVGALPLLLAVLAVIFRPRWERLVTAVIGLACLAVVFGIPPVFDAVTALPVFSSGHNGRLIPYFTLCAALLAGWGAGDLMALRRRAGRRTQVTIIVTGAVLALPAVIVLAVGAAPLDQLGRAVRVAWMFASPAPPDDPTFIDVNRLNSVLLWLPAIGAATLLVLLRARLTVTVRWFTILAAALIVIDLFRAGMGRNPAIPESQAVPPETPAIKFLQERRDRRIAEFPQFPANVLAMDYGLYSSTGYDLPIERRYDELWRRWISPEYPTQISGINALPLSLPRLDESRLRVLALLGTGWILQAPGEIPVDTQGLREAYNGLDARIFEVEDSVPRAYLVGGQRVAGSPGEALDLVGSLTFKPRREAITETPVDGIPTASSPRPGTARVTDASDPDVLVVETVARRDSLLVVTDNWFPGWKATVDGEEAAVERVNYTQRAVRVPAGQHEVRFEYSPASWTAGWIISLATLVAIAAVAGWASLRRRRGRLA
jgi:hypothetical protein